MATPTGRVSPAKVFARSTTGTIWMGPKQQAALHHLSGKALIRVVLGPPSSGKSTILREFQRRAEDALVLPVAGPRKSAVGVLSALLKAAGLGPWNLSEIEQRNLLTVFMQQRSMQGKRIVVCIDNISRFSEQAWSEIERLRLLQFANKPLVELAVAGTEADAARPPLEQLLHESATSAIEAVYFLSAPTDHDIAGYIHWRLAQHGLVNRFSEDACKLVNCLTRGRFSYVNILCQVVLMEQAREHCESVDAGLVNKAAASLAALKDNGTTSDTAELKRLEKVDSGPAPPKGHLVVSCNRKVVRKVDLNGRTLIGRDKDNDLFLESQYLSRHHAVVLPTPEGRYFIVDLNSTNGVIVNGKLVSHSFLQDGDVVGLCQFRLKVELDRETVETPEPAGVGADDDTDNMPGPIFKMPPVRIVKN